MSSSKLGKGSIYYSWTAAQWVNNFEPNVLSKFSNSAGRDVVIAVARQLASKIGISQPAECSNLETDKEVLWCMQVISYGLGLPLNEHDIIRDCVNIYCDWLSALNYSANISVPMCIRQEPNFFARIIICQLRSVFMPRLGDGDLINKQAVLCHRILRTLQNIAKGSRIIEPDTWQTLLLLLITVNDVLLSPPTIKDDVGDQLCERILGVLFEVWLVACHKSFPSPPLWKAFREAAIAWRHRGTLISCWSRVMLALTSKLVQQIYGVIQIPYSIEEEPELRQIVNALSGESVAQSWFRMLHTIGDVSQLKDMRAISKSPQFRHHADPTLPTFQHPCLASMPSIFHSAVKAVSDMVDVFLNCTNASNKEMAKPRCNSILHVFGEWLFNAAYIPISHQSNTISDDEVKRCSASLECNVSRTSSTGGRSVGGGSSQPNSLTEGDGAPLHWDCAFIRGHAQAIATLCHIVTSKCSAEEISTIYLSRFYSILRQCLLCGLQGSGEECELLVGSVLTNGQDLFRINLMGVSSLLPQIIDSLELILPDPDRTAYSMDIRRSAIHILLSILPLPTHLQCLPLRELPAVFNSLPCDEETIGLFKPRLVNLLINSLQVETDSHNIQLLLGGLSFIAHDAALSLHAQESFQRKEHDSDKNSPRALLATAVYFTSHKLLSSWKSDLNTSLAALELLRGLAQLNVPDAESKRAVKWLCDFVTYQCAKPPLAHSKDVHSSIVAAFQCISFWLMGNHNLTRDKEVLQVLMQVIELGISGTCSYGKPGESPKLKSQKELKPVSMRVRDAAESLLSIIVERTGTASDILGPEWSSTLLDESNFTSERASDFQYFLLNGNTLLASQFRKCMEQPTVVLILRNAFGRYSWSLQMRMASRHQSAACNTYNASNAVRPVCMERNRNFERERVTEFLDSMPNIPSCRVDEAIPNLESLANDDGSFGACENSHIWVENDKRGCAESTPPEVSKRYQATRMMLSHFGLLTSVSNASQSNNDLENLVWLDSGTDLFLEDVENLDKTATRPRDTCHIFYVKAGQRTSISILKNVEDKQLVSGNFKRILSTLGRPIVVGEHIRWTDLQVIEEGGELDGKKRTLYWADINSEIAFVVPTLNSSDSNSTKESKRLEFLSDNTEETLRKQNFESSEPNAHKGKSSSETSEPNAVPRRRSHEPCSLVAAIWLEHFQDYSTFPIKELLPYMEMGSDCRPSVERDCHLIFLHQLKNGLLRVKLIMPPNSRASVATPLMDGMVVNERVVGTLLRQTALNMCSRRRLHADNYQPPMVRRRHRIQEFGRKYRSSIPISNFLVNLFKDNSSRLREE